MKVRFFKGGFIAGLLVLGVSMGAQARSVSVVSVSDDVVTLNFGAGDGKAYKLAVARGAYDAGDVRADWDAIEIIGDVAVDQSSATWTVPKGEYRYARFFLLDTDLPFTKSCAFVRSNYKCWIDTGVQARSGVRAELDMTAKAISDCTILGAREGSTRFFLMHLNSTSFNSMSQQLGNWKAPSDKTGQYHSYGWRHPSVISEILPTSRALYQCSTTPGESATLTQTYALNKTLYLFACNYDGTAKQFSDIALIRGKIWLDGELKRDYIPVVADGQGALFDLVSREVFPDRSGNGFEKGGDVETPMEAYLTGASSATVEIRKPGTLVAQWDFLHNPSAVVGNLSLPQKVLDKSPWTIRVRFMVPSSGAGTVRNILQGAPGGTYSLSADNQIGAYAVTADQWHTLTIEGGPARFDSYFDETKLLSSVNADAKAYLKGLEGLRLTTDGSIRYASVEVWSAAGVGEGRNPVETKADMTGEWTFPTDNPTRATKGRDLEKFANVSSNAFNGQSLDDGVVEGDTSMHVGRYCGFRCRHGLATNSSYSVVMDVRVPTGAVKGLHGVFQADTFCFRDCCMFFNKDDEASDALKAWVASGNSIETSIRCGDWCRVVLTYVNGGEKTLYLNGVNIDHRAYSGMKIMGPYFYFGIDNSGEDNDIDISYAAIYNRVLTDAEVAADFARPTAHASPSGEILLRSPLVGRWEKENDVFVSRADGAPALTAQPDGGFTLTRSTAPAGMTVVVDLRLPYVQSRGGVIMANANGVATGVFASNSALNGCLATAPSATIFGTGAETDADTWGGCTYEPLWRASKQRVAVTWDAQGRVRYYANGQMICPQDPTASDVAACPTSTMNFLSGIGAYATRLEVYDGVLTPFEVASLGGIEFVPPPSGVLIMVR